MITVLAGGTGSVKLVRGLVSQESKVNVISNVGDNYWLYGLYVCPDIDTIVYGLADLLDQERGWGIKKDTFNFLRQMEVFGEETWFGVGDRDAATHLIRTNMLKNGKISATLHNGCVKNLQLVQTSFQLQTTVLKLELSQTKENYTYKNIG